MDKTEHTIAASMHFGQAVQAREYGNQLSTELVDEAYDWAVETEWVKPYAGFVPDLESLLNTNDQMAQDYCYRFDVNLMDYSDSIEYELGEPDSGPGMG